LVSDLIREDFRSFSNGIETLCHNDKLVSWYRVFLDGFGKDAFTFAIGVDVGIVLCDVGFLSNRVRQERLFVLTQLVMPVSKLNVRNAI